MKKDYHLNETIKTVDVESVYHNENDDIVIDVRAPVEYDKGHIINSINIHMFDDEERAVIGKLYKSFGQSVALEKGYDYIQSDWQRFLSKFNFLPKKKRIIVTCARGGLRSKTITTLLDRLGFNVAQLKGGFQAYRKYVQQKLNRINLPYLVVIDGLTGTSKTQVISKLNNVINLEYLAGHSGSVFGHIEKVPVKQKIFEERLVREIDAINSNEVVYIEAESRRIGKVEIPITLFQQMQNSKKVLLTAKIHIRARRMIKEYVFHNPKNQADLANAIYSLRHQIPERTVEYLIELIWEKKYYDLSMWFLTKYYDKKYLHNINKSTYLKTIESNNITNAVNELKQFSITYKK